MLRSILNAGSALARLFGRTFAVIGKGASSVFDLIAEGAAGIVDLPFALVRGLRQQLSPVPAQVPVAPAQSAADEVMAALQDARRRGPEAIIADGQALQRHIEANLPRFLKPVDPAVIEGINKLHAATKKGYAASVIAHWARGRVDGIAPDSAETDLKLLPEHLQVWARSLSDAQIAEVAKLPRQMLHHHLTSSDCRRWCKALPAASLDTAERAKHAIRAAHLARQDGSVDPYPQQQALDGMARKRELDAYEDFEPAGLRV